MNKQDRYKYDKLKEEYKEHYRRIREVKEKLRRSKSVQNISNAMQKMNTDELLETVDYFLDKVKNKVAVFEARLDLAIDNLMQEDTLEKKTDLELDEELRKEKARESLKKMKIEMGLLYEELEKKAMELQVDKTVGPGKQGGDVESEAKNKPDREL